MNKLVWLILGIGGTAYAGYYFVPERMPAFIHPEGRACSRMASLCGENSPKECEDTFAELRKLSGPDAIRKPIKCVMEADSCAESIGCLGGAGLNAGIKAYQDVLKGLSKSIGE